uniref:Cytochrome c oxidase subunit 2 n=3 Tax=Monolepta hieroglyphica TaxID=327932 RepID=A0A891T8C9_9CUCU|nr:cytochrome c oxidase subunit II [Monolepta quadriguttata]YP_010164561.1 cytochrome c oxidase subunit II [Monolepta hieroglyphica]YP_010399072.1 cytochrome c oxidase subunit II [Monolepta signata]AST14980.1 cytochrome c oxidase subunit II [Monolepta quadriguttata]QRM91324.1 cytochrome c oxidase subunit 2 [Monolepta hieroglyphica]QTH79277.1 cytochrome c oxidase subunit II [Monolepta hieroglyphica]QUA05765.1 cytochrome c oxidase subunit II [Monolepta hieroglyphica]UFP05635.1 cytochrome c oxi
MSTWKNLMLQDSASPLMEQLSYFHDHAMMILVIITVLVGQLMITLFFNKFLHRYLLEGQLIELIWTILPTIILIFIAIPSLRLIYILDEINNPMITLKTIGHQWYWSYEYSDFKKIEFDSYMIPTNEINNFNFRLLDVDNRVILPFESNIRLLVTAADVIHSWTIPSLGVKIDATPGRLNQVSFTLNRSGLFYGQCSEICGANHSFMPIVIESISPNYFSKWITKMI